MTTTSFVPHPHLDSPKAPLVFASISRTALFLSPPTPRDPPFRSQASNFFSSSPFCDTLLLAEGTDVASEPFVTGLLKQRATERAFRDNIVLSNEMYRGTFMRRAVN